MQKGLAPIVWIIILAVLLGGGYSTYHYFSTSRSFCWPYCPGMTDQDRETIKKSAREVQTANWKTYRNDKYGFEFRYPAIFEKVTDKVYIKYIAHPQGFNWYRVELIDTGADERPFMRFEVDPDGYGPFFPDKVYKVEETESGNAQFVFEDTLRDTLTSKEEREDGQVLIIPQALKSRNGRTYYWQFSFKEGGKDWEPVFKEILSTFRFTK